MGVDILACYHGCGPPPPGAWILLWAVLPIVLGKRWARNARSAGTLWFAAGWTTLPLVLCADSPEVGFGLTGAMLVTSAAWIAQALLKECIPGWVVRVRRVADPSLAR
jgi:hypothetical protein